MTCWDFRLHEAQIPLRVCKCCGVFISPPSVSVSTFESGSWDIRETICSQWPINACHVTPATHKNTFNVTVCCLYGFKARVHGWQTLCFSGLQDDLYGFPPFSLSPSVAAWSTHVGSVTAVLRLQCVWALPASLPLQVECEQGGQAQETVRQWQTHGAGVEGKSSLSPSVSNSAAFLVI